MNYDSSNEYKKKSPHQNLTQAQTQPNSNPTKKPISKQKPIQNSTQTQPRPNLDPTQNKPKKTPKQLKTNPNICWWNNWPLFSSAVGTWHDDNPYYKNQIAN